MYAVFEDGSRQYKVSQGALVKVDYRDIEVGTRVEFPRVLLYRDGDNMEIGQPAVDGMRIVGEVVDHPSTKYTIQKFRRRKNYRRRKGHRQYFTLVKVEHILLPGQEAPPPAEKRAPQQPAATEGAPAAPAPSEQPAS